MRLLLPHTDLLAAPVAVDRRTSHRPRRMTAFAGWMGDGGHMVRFDVNEFMRGIPAAPSADQILDLLAIACGHCNRAERFAEPREWFEHAQLTLWALEATPTAHRAAPLARLTIELAIAAVASGLRERPSSNARAEFSYLLAAVCRDLTRLDDEPRRMPTGRFPDELTPDFELHELIARYCLLAENAGERRPQLSH